MNNSQNQGYGNQSAYGGQGYQSGGGYYQNQPPAYGQAQPQYESPYNQDVGVQQPGHVYNRDAGYAAPPTGPPPKQ